MSMCQVGNLTISILLLSPSHLHNAIQLSYSLPRPQFFVFRFICVRDVSQRSEGDTELK